MPRKNHRDGERIRRISLPRAPGLLPFSEFRKRYEPLAGSCCAAFARRGLACPCPEAG